MRARRVAPLLAVFATLACESSNPSSPTNDEIIMHLIGPLMTVDAEASVSSNYNSAANATTTLVGGGSAIRAAGGQPSLRSTPFTFSGSIVTSGHLTPGTYTNASPGVSANITLTNAGPLMWQTTAGSGASVGTFTLVISHVTVLVNTASGIGYEVQGTFEASVPPVLSSGATGTETVHVDFSSN